MAKPVKRPADTPAYQLTKRFRREEMSRRPQQTWTKNIIDLNNNKYLTRTPINWLLLLIFYIVFLGTLVVCLFSICMVVFFTTLRDDVPTDLPKQPGLSFQPCIIKKIDCAVNFRVDVEDDYMPYADLINQFVNKYSEKESDLFGPCKWASEYGFKAGEPCIFLKVNRVIGFEAKTFEEVTDLPVSAPDELRDYINSLPLNNRTDKLWLSCSDNTGQVNMAYYPHRYVASSDVELPKKVVKRDSYLKTFFEDGDHVAINADKIFYDDNDLRRIVAVQLTGVPRDTNIRLQCYLWAKNVNIDKHRGRGYLNLHINIKS